jgi:hypothetical protein
MKTIYIILSLSVLGAYPDLIPNGLHIEGDKITIGVKNNGDFIATNVVVYVEAETDIERNNPIGQAIVKIESLAVGDTKKVTVNLNDFSWRRPFKKGDTKRIKIRVDPKNQIIEKSRHVRNAESNNVLTKYINQ